jgi:hypothetical protein
MIRWKGVGRGFAMDSSFVGRAALWIGVYLFVVLAPLFALLLGDHPPARDFWTEFANAIGYAGLSIMGLQFGLTARFRFITVGIHLKKTRSDCDDYPRNSPRFQGATDAIRAFCAICAAPISLSSYGTLPWLTPAFPARAAPCWGKKLDTVRRRASAAAALRFVIRWPATAIRS